MEPLPKMVVTRLKTAAASPKERRIQAVNETVKWAKLHFPRYFQDVKPSDLPAIRMPALETYLKQLKSINYSENLK